MNQGQPPVVSSAFPDPPSKYIALYTDENVANGTAPEPPKPIVDGSYTCFGQTIVNEESIIRPLESQGIRRLYPRDFDHKKELKKMNHSILVNFLDLIDILVKCPDTARRDDKIADVQMLFVQMHHLINELRPHQARETIRSLLHNQKRSRLETTIKMKAHIEKVIVAINDYLSMIPDDMIESKNKFDRDIERLRNLQLVETNTEEDQINELIELDSIMFNLVQESNYYFVPVSILHDSVTLSFFSKL